MEGGREAGRAGSWGSRRCAEGREGRTEGKERDKGEYEKDGGRRGTENEEGGRERSRSLRRQRETEAGDVGSRLRERYVTSASERRGRRGRAGGHGDGGGKGETGNEGKEVLRVIKGKIIFRMEVERNLKNNDNK